jgi:hypothetical protein
VGRADADGIAQRNFVTTHRMEAGGHAHHVRHRHLALIGAAEHRGHVAAHPDPIGGRTFEHRGEARDRLVDAGVDVLAVEGLRGGGEHRDFLGADGAGALVALSFGTSTG